MQKQKIMVVVSVLMGSLLMACSTMTKAERKAKEAEQAKLVNEALDNGSTSIDVMSRKREGISYSGQMDIW